MMLDDTDTEQRPLSPTPSLISTNAVTYTTRARLLRVTLFCATVSLSISQTMTLSALLSPNWIEFEGGSPEPLDKPVGTTILLSISLFFGSMALVAMLLRFFKRHPHRTLAVALAANVLNALMLLISACTASTLSAKIVPPDAVLSRSSYGVVSMIVAVTLACLAAVLLVVEHAFGKRNEYIPDNERRLSLAITLISLYIAFGGFLFNKIEGFDYEESVVFCTSTITTIGYGNVSPVTVVGRITCIFYAIFGILQVGYTIDGLRRIIVETIDEFIHTHERGQGHFDAIETANKIRKTKYMVIITAVFVLWFGGAAIFASAEGWTYFEGFWMAFVTLSTIGYGDFYPTSRTSEFLFPFFAFLGLGVFALMLSTLGEQTKRQLETRFVYGKKGITRSNTEPLLQHQNENRMLLECIVRAADAAIRPALIDQANTNSVLNLSANYGTLHDTSVNALHVSNDMLTDSIPNTATADEAINSSSAEVHDDDAVMRQYLEECRALLINLRKQTHLE